MIKVLSTRSRSVFVPVCEAKKPKENPINISRKAFEKKRSVTLKENVNTLLKIANIDIKEAGDFIKELDELHKDALKKAFKKDGKEDSESDSVTVVDEDENIFKK
jgi:hypothetical protein